MTIKYEPGGVKVRIGQAQVVELPPRVFRARLSCIHFDTDKSFMLPMSLPGIRNIKSYYDQHPGLTVLVNGHTDRVGQPAWNLDLSVERAKSIAAYLTSSVDDWMPWYSSGIASKRWSYREDQHMLSTVTDASGAPYYAGPIDGVNSPATQDAARQFQTDNGLAVDGFLGPETRRALVTKYMELEGTTLPATATLVTHGCGEAHPIDQTEAADEDNRRVEIFLFDGPIDPPVQDPCPSPSGCTSYEQWKGRARDNIDLCQPVTLMAPRWEAPDDPEADELAMVLFDARRDVCANRPATVIAGDKRIFGVTDSGGVLRVPVPPGAKEVKVRYTPNDTSTTVELAVKLGLGPVSDDAAAKDRLTNLGYAPEADLQTAVYRFQIDFEVEPASGELDATTRARLAQVHDEVS
ncbi:MAG: peptidoglycan-binding protein [Myxococcales bacterium]|nr:peptidoglycan-binding protein [Myxococcales bacterium]